MCGISGAIGKLTCDFTEIINRMSAAQRHRGPDGHGIWSSLDENCEGDGVVLAHRRLAIIDLSDAGAQPMIDPDCGNVVVFNGEIFNFQMLKSELEMEHGVRFRSSSDTEVILKSYAVWGIECVKRFRGMFAFGLFDAQRKIVHLVRDRVGVKPLYWTKVTNREGKQLVLFSSELRAILASELVPRRLDPIGISTYLWNGFVHGPHTIIQNINLLDPGSILAIALGDLKLERSTFWTLPKNADESVTDVGTLRSELEEAVRLRLISDVPLGVFLSGGIDSSAVSAIAAGIGQGQVHTFNIAFEEQDYDESLYAQAVSKAIGATHTELLLTEKLFHEQLDDAIECLDQPSFDAINTYFVSRAVRDAGVRVALAGTGGDELFGGYSSFRDIPKAVRWSRMTSHLPRSLKEPALRMFLLWLNRGNLVPRQTRWGKLRDLIDAEGDLNRIYQVSYALFTREFLRQLSKDPQTPDLWGRSVPQNSKINCDSADPVRLHAAISNLELESFIGQRLLRDTDCASMAVSLEVRVPLLDHRLIEEVSRIEHARRFLPLGRKSLLRELALSKLDPKIFDRPKSGFVLPFERWMKKTLRGRIQTMFADRQLAESVGLQSDAVLRLHQAFEAGAQGLYWSRIWSLYVLMWWARNHNAHL